MLPYPEHPDRTGKNSVSAWYFMYYVCEGAPQLLLGEYSLNLTSVAANQNGRASWNQ